MSFAQILFLATATRSRRPSNEHNGDNERWAYQSPAGCPCRDSRGVSRIQETSFMCVQGSVKAGIRCCSDRYRPISVCANPLRGGGRPKTCLRGNSSTDPTSATLSQAEDECAGHGRRLCTMRELKAGIPCRTGCGLDTGTPIWSTEECKSRAKSRKPNPRTCKGTPIVWGGGSADNSRFSNSSTTSRSVQALVLVNAHEHSAFIDMQVDNVLRHTASMQVHVVLSVTAALWDALRGRRLPANVSINPVTMEKERHTGTLIHGIISNLNFFFIHLRGRADFILILSSRSVFLRPLDYAGLTASVQTCSANLASSCAHVRACNVESTPPAPENGRYSPAKMCVTTPQRATTRGPALATISYKVNHLWLLFGHHLCAICQVGARP